MNTTNQDSISIGREVLRCEVIALEAVSQKLGATFVKASDLIAGTKGRVITTGIGKSGYIAQKISSTLSSTGTPSHYIHPSEALHGDFGMMQSGDVLIALTFGGETREVLAVATFAKEIGVPVIAITGRMQSSLSHLADVVLDGGVPSEADPFGLVPTASSTAALALGDALAVCVMRRKAFSRENFGQLHPGGLLGRSLMCVKDVMRPLEQLPLMVKGSGFHDILEAVTTPNFGIAAVVDDATRKMLVGSVSDGDVRRSLLKHGGNALGLLCGDLMTTFPKMISSSARAEEAIAVMEEFKITALFVSQGDTRELLGLIRLHDLISAKVL